MPATTESAAPRNASLPLTQTPLAFATDSAQLDHFVGSCIGERFRLTDLIARGGMGRVYRAEQAPLGRACALKILDSSRLGDAALGLDRRFFLEATVTAKLRHPNIVTVFDCGRTGDGVPYIAMEYLVGCTLSRAIRAAGYFSECRTVRVARQICGALREAHAAGVVHRDLKPTNVFLVENGDEADFVKVLDFGLVTRIAADGGEELTEKNLLLGSPRCMAPEQIRGEKVDARADIYALGVVMYEMMTGRVPFERSTNVQILTAHLNERPPPMRPVDCGNGPSPQMEWVVARCLEKHREQRFRSMAELLDALDRVTEPVPAHAAAIWEPSDTGVSDAQPDDRGRGEGQPPAQRSPACDAQSLLRPVVCGWLGILAVALLVGSGARRQHVRSASSEHRIAKADAVTMTAAALASPRDARSPSAASHPDAAVEITTDPPGCRVKEGDLELCRSTPCAILYEDEEEASHLLTFACEGYVTAARWVTTAEGSVTVTLTPAPSVPAPPPAAARPPEDRAPTRLFGYRLDIPY